MIRYGQLYGPGTFYPGAPPQPPRIHVDDAARQTLPALGVPPGVTIVADDRAAGAWRRAGSVGAEDVNDEDQGVGALDPG